MSRRFWRTTMLLGGVLAAASSPVLAQWTDECGPGSPALTLGMPLAGSTDGAGQSSVIAGSFCGGYEGAGGYADVFARFTPSVSGGYKFTTCGVQADTVISIHTGCPATEANLIECGDDDYTCTDNGVSTVSVKLTGGVEYVVRVATPELSTPGPFSLVVTQLPSVANDECSAAVAVTPGSSTPGTNVNATGTSVGNCFLNSNGDGNDVWYSLAITTPGVYTIDVAADNGYNLALTLHSGCPGTTGNMIGCDDYNFTTNRPQIDKFLAAGTYSIRVAGERGFGGRPEEDSFVLNVSNAKSAVGNDTCAGAVVLNPGDTVGGSTVNSTPDGITGSCSNHSHYEVWYKLNITTTAQYVVSIQPTSGWTPTMALFTGCGTGEVDCQYYFSSIVQPLTAGGLYYIRVAGDSDSVGDFDITLDAGTPIPGNDLCANPTSVGVGTTPSTNLAASGSDETPDCGFDDTRDVWYRFTAPSAGYYTFDTLGTTELGDTTIALYGSCGSSPLVCNNDISQGETYNVLSMVGRVMAQNEQVLVRVAGNGGSAGNFDLNIAGPLATPPVPPHDTYDNARVIVGDSYTDSTDPRSATPDIFSDCIPPNLLQSPYGVWYRFTAPDDGVFTFQEVGGFNALHALTSFYQPSPGALPIENLPIQCGTITLDMQGGESFLFLVSMQGVEYPASNYNVTATFTPKLGCCQTPGGCMIQRESTCAGTWTESLCGPSATYTGGTNLPFSMPNPPSNDNPTYISSSITVADNAPLTNLTVTVQFTHSSFNQVRMRLTTPWGAQIQLLIGEMGSGQFNGTYTFSDLALDTFFNQTDFFPFASKAYQSVSGPIGPSIVGHTAAGQWTLSAGDDRTGGSLGQVTNWSLNLYGQCAVACAADFNGVNGVTVQDIFDFLTAWLAGNSSADFNHVNGVTVQDIFDFLTAWLAGC